MCVAQGVSPGRENAPFSLLSPTRAAVAARVGEGRMYVGILSPGVDTLGYTHTVPPGLIFGYFPSLFLSRTHVIIRKLGVSKHALALQSS